MSNDENISAKEQKDEPKQEPSLGRRLDYLLTLGKRWLYRRLPAEEARAVRQQVEDDGQLTERYVLMCALSAGIATLGLLQNSIAVVIGAMLVSPLMSPIARLGFAFGSFDVERAQAAARVLLVGASVGMTIGILLTWLSPIRNATPEIIARTAPTLLDLAVAVLSGMAGGYATVHRRGETAIGVAIATALMPPMATVGYSIAVARFDFAMGALLLFLTNLAAIAFSFALVARLRGVVRPFSQIEFKRRYVVFGVAAFLALATPLTLTLRRVTQEAIALQTTRRELAQLFKMDASQVAQLSVTWTNLKPPSISATIITPRFIEEADTELRDALSQKLHVPAQVELRQIVASDPEASAQAIVNAALGHAQNAAASAARAPVDAVKDACRARVLQAWPDDNAHDIKLLVAPTPGWSLKDYQAEETRMRQLGYDWSVSLIPPYQERIAIAFADDAVTLQDAQRESVESAAWALARWGVTRVRVEGLAGAATGATRTSRILAEGRAARVAGALQAHGLRVDAGPASRETARVLAREGVERVRGADILPFAAP